jgi:hypothetical protein
MQDAESHDDAMGRMRVPGACVLVRVQFVDPVYRDRADQDTQGIGRILAFQHDPTWFFGFMDVGRSGKRAGKCSLRKSSE